MVSGWNDCFKDVCINLFNLGQWPAFVTLQITGLKYRYAHKHDYGTWNTDIYQKGSTMRVHWTLTTESDSEFQVFLQCKTFTLTNSDLVLFFTDYNTTFSSLQELQCNSETVTGHFKLHTMYKHTTTWGTKNYNDRLTKLTCCICIINVDKSSVKIIT